MDNRPMAEVLADALDLTDQPGQTWSWEQMSEGLKRFFDYLRTLDDPKLALDATALVGVVQALALELDKYRGAEQVVRDVRAIAWDWHPYVEPLVAFLEAERAGSGEKLRELVSALSVHEVAVGRPLRVEVYDSTDHEEHVEHRWRVVHTSNGENMGYGEGYVDRRDRDAAVATLFPGVEVAEVDG